MKALEPSKVIKLPQDVKERLEELRTLSKKAEAGDKGARQELKQALLESSADVIARASEAGRKAQHLLIDTLAADNPLTEYALSARLDLMRAEIAGEDPTPLEALLVERIVAAWILNELLEVLNCAQLWRGNSKPHSAHSFLRFYLNWQQQAHQRLLSSIKASAQVRKLQSNMPRIQYNTQINLGSSDAKQTPHE